MEVELDPVTGAVYSFFRNFDILCKNFEKRSTALQLLGLSLPHIWTFLWPLFSQCCNVSRKQARKSPFAHIQIYLHSTHGLFNSFSSYLLTPRHFKSQLSWLSNITDGTWERRILIEFVIQFPGNEPVKYILRTTKYVYKYFPPEGTTGSTMLCC